MKKFNDAEEEDEVQAKMAAQDRAFEAEQQAWKQVSEPTPEVKAAIQHQQGAISGAHSPNTVIRIAIQNQVGEKKIMNFETFVDQQTPALAVHGLVDRLMAVADRQIKKYEILDLQRHLVGLENQLKGVQESQEELSKKNVSILPEGHRKPQDDKKLKADIQNLQTNIGHIKQNIIRVRTQIDEAKKELAAL